MILVDTSVWVDHLRFGEPLLAAAIEADEVATHPFVVGELACGNLRDRAVLAFLADLPVVTLASDAEALAFVEAYSLMGRGIGYLDVHLLASTVLTDGTRLWTRDGRLERLACELEMAYQERRS